MNLEDRQEQLTRWIDGELAGEELREFENAVAADPQLAEAKAEAESLRNLLKADMPAREIPNPEFFNSQIQRRISEDSAPAARAAAQPGGSIFSWFRSPFTLASAAAVAVLGFFALQNPSGVEAPDHTSVASTYTPDKDIDANHFYSDAADATVIMLDGLAALPDSTELNGQNIVSTEPGAPGELYNESSELAFVIIEGADSVPDRPLILGTNTTMLPRLTLSYLAIAVALLGSPACAQEPVEKEKKSEKVEKKGKDKDPNAKPNIPKNAAVDAVVWGAVVYAKEGGKVHKMPEELPDLEKRLTKIKGFESYKNFEVIGQHTQKVFSEYTNWLVPSKELFLNIDSKGPAEDGGMNLHVQLWRRTKVLVKTDTTLKKGSPLIIGGPKWRDGQLIFVLLLK